MCSIRAFLSRYKIALEKPDKIRDDLKGERHPKRKEEVVLWLHVSSVASPLATERTDNMDATSSRYALSYFS